MLNTSACSELPLRVVFFASFLSSTRESTLESVFSVSAAIVVGTTTGRCWWSEEEQDGAVMKELGGVLGELRVIWKLWIEGGRVRHSEVCEEREEREGAVDEGSIARKDRRHCHLITTPSSNGMPLAASAASRTVPVSGVNAG